LVLFAFWIHFKAALGTKRFIIIRAAFPEVTTPL
jgi:hypothetical protein